MNKRELSHQYPVECTVCGHQTHIIRTEEPYPKYGDQIPLYCSRCEDETIYTPVLTKQMKAEMRLQAEEEALKDVIVKRCAFYGFKCRFFLQSVIISTPVAKWQFDYHEKLKTLRHENHFQFDRKGMHYQFRNRYMRNVQVIDYIANHDGYGYKRKNGDSDKYIHQ